MVVIIVSNLNNEIKEYKTVSLTVSNYIRILKKWYLLDNSILKSSLNNFCIRFDIIFDKSDFCNFNSGENFESFTLAWKLSNRVKKVLQFSWGMGVTEAYICSNMKQIYCVVKTTDDDSNILFYDVNRINDSISL